jgi:hypothetical protein
MATRLEVERRAREWQELHLLADFVRAQADGLAGVWPELLSDTYYEIWKKRRESPDVE